MFNNRKVAKRLQKIGSQVDIQYLVYVNEFEPKSFTSQQEAFNYLKTIRDENVIHRLQIYRIETYSL